VHHTDVSAGVARGHAAHQPERRRELGGRLGFEAEHGAVEQRGLVDVVERRAQCHVVDAGQQA
jgi:hypothetical protein